MLARKCELNSNLLQCFLLMWFTALRKDFFLDPVFLWSTSFIHPVLRWLNGTALILPVITFKTNVHLVVVKRMKLEISDV